MSLAPILLAGGSGLVGRCAAGYLRAANPDVPLLIGARNLDKAQEVAAEVGNAEGVEIDLATVDLGLRERPVGAVAMLPRDDMVAGLRFAQSRGVPYIGISSGVAEIAPEVATYIQRPNASAVVLGAEWLVGAATVPTLEFAKAFGRLNSIRIGALLGEKDTGGPAAVEDIHRVTTTMPAVLTRRGGTFAWHLGDESTSQIRAAGGGEVEAVAFSPFDVMGLAAATDAPNVKFRLATGVRPDERDGEPMTAKILIELSGEDQAGQPLRTRHAVLHPKGQMPLTALGVAMVLERLVGLDGRPAARPGLYFPHQLLEPTAYFARLEQIGGTIVSLDAL